MGLLEAVKIIEDVKEVVDVISEVVEDVQKKDE